MLSDESSSDSETGRFKSSCSKQDEKKYSGRRDETHKSSRRSRPSENDKLRMSESGRFRPSDSDRLRRDFDRRRDSRDCYERRDRSRERIRPPRHSPVTRRHSREKSSDRSRRSLERNRKSPEKSRRSLEKNRRSLEKNRRSPEKSRRSAERIKLTKDLRDGSKLRQRNSSKDRENSHSRSLKSSDRRPEPRRDLKEEIRRNLLPNTSRNESSGKFNRARSKDSSESPEFKSKRSIVQKPTHEPPKRKSISPIDVDKQPESGNESDEVQPGSYYSMIPAVVKEKSVEKEITEESSEIDSSDDERLRAKLLNLEKELSKTRKKKHKKKHKKKSSKSKNEKDRDTSSSVEVTSTTDIQEKTAEAESNDVEIIDVTSTQVTIQKESSEEGEISSDDDSKNSADIDPSDLRHKLKRQGPKADTSESADLRERLKAKTDVCGPALPPHLEKRSKSSSPDIEGPALPPHLKKKDRNIGPSIPSEMRKVLAESDRDVIKYESSDEDAGIGPLPAGTESKWTDAHKKLEERALDIKIRKLDGHTLKSTDVKEREKWMLELPEAKAKIIGLEARSFRAKEGPDMSDRSTWTDTPEQKARKAAGLEPAEEDTTASLKKEAHARHVSKRDEEQEKEAKKHKKKHKREESLLEIHQKKLKKKKKKEDKEDGGKKERRPFSRDTDLQANRFDDAQKKSIIKKAQQLDTRFSTGEAKYL